MNSDWIIPWPITINLQITIIQLQMPEQFINLTNSDDFQICGQNKK